MLRKNIFILFSLSLMLLASCSRNETLLFDESAAERARHSVENAEKYLVEAPNGWEMLYFANTETRGYHFLITFKENGNVSISAKNNLTTRDKLVTDTASVWEIISDFGPIITFNTYNTVLHAFSDPQTDGDGYLGDYEFLILSSSENELQLKGKKHGAYSVLRRLPEGISKEQYFADVEAMQEKIAANNNLLQVVVNDSVRTLHEAATGIFILSNKGEMYPEVDYEWMPFIATRTGIHIMEDFDNTTELERDFELVDGKLVGSAKTISTGNLNEYFESMERLSSLYWNIDLENINSTSKSKLEALNKEFVKMGNKKAGVTAVRLLYSSELKKYLIEFKYTFDGTPTNYWVGFEMNCTADASKIILSYKGAYDENSENVNKTFTNLEPFFKTFEGDYTLTTTNVVNPSLKARLTNINNSDIWFDITGTLK